MIIAQEEIRRLVERLSREDYISRARLNLNIINLYPKTEVNYPYEDFYYVQAALEYFLTGVYGFKLDEKGLGYERAEGQ